MGSRAKAQLSSQARGVLNSTTYLCTLGSSIDNMACSFLAAHLVRVRVRVRVRVSLVANLPRVGVVGVGVGVGVSRTAHSCGGGHFSGGGRQDARGAVSTP